MKITGMNPAEDIPPEHAAPRLLPPAGVEADRRDRRRPGREHRAGVRDPRRRLHGARHGRAAAVVGDVEQGTPAAEGAQAGRRAHRRRRQAAHRRPTPSRSTQISETVGAHKGDARRLHGRPRRPGADGHRQHVPRQRSPSATASASATTRTRASEPAGPIRASRPRAGRDVVGDVRARSATSRRSSTPEKRKEIGSVVGGYETTRAGDLDRRDDRAVRARAHLAQRSASSTCSRSCRSTAGTSSGRWPRRCAGKAIPFSVMERAGLRGLRARAGAVR